MRKFKIVHYAETTVTVEAEQFEIIHNGGAFGVIFSSKGMATHYFHSPMKIEEVTNG